MKKHFGRKRAPQSDEMTLQITSMADIFTIILVFLLKSYATSAIDIAPTPGMILPKAYASEAPLEALKIEVSESSIQIEGEPVLQLDHFRFPAGELQGDGSSKRMGEALAKHRERQTLIASANSDVKIDPKVIVVSDQRAPYSTVKAVLASAAVNGFTDFKLAVVRGD